MVMEVRNRKCVRQYNPIHFFTDYKRHLWINKTLSMILLQNSCSIISYYGNIWCVCTKTMMLYNLITISTRDINVDVNCLRTVRKLLDHTCRYCNINCVAAPPPPLNKMLDSHYTEYKCYVAPSLYIPTYIRDILNSRITKYVSYPVNCVF